MGGRHDAYLLHVKHQAEVYGLWIGSQYSISHATCMTVLLGFLLFSLCTNCPRHVPTSLNLLSLMRHFSNPENGLVKCPGSLQWSILIWCGLLNPRRHDAPLTWKKIEKFDLMIETASILRRNQGSWVTRPLRPEASLQSRRATMWSGGWLKY